MDEQGDFAETLRAFMRRARRSDNDLAGLTGLSARTIEKWRTGEVRRPRLLGDLLKVARALHLDAGDTSALLTAAGHRPLDDLCEQARQTQDAQLLALLEPWMAALSAAARCHQLRAPIADFVGRAHEVARLAAALQAALKPGGGALISAVQGMGGIGKTELAYVAAHRVREAFPDAQIVLHLRGASASPLTAEQALQTVIHAFTPNVELPNELETLQASYSSILHERHVLILADDARDATQVRPLIPPPGSALLATSRQRFTLPGMDTIALEQLHADEAVALLRGICPRLGVDAARAIAAACEYLPLALRISASLLHSDPALSVADFLGRLGDEQQRLVQLRDPDDPQLDLVASLSLSYAMLDSPARQIFCQLGVFVADFSMAMALAVVEAPAGVDVVATLHHLLRRNLVMYDPQRERWRLHDLVRDLARRYLKELDEAEAVWWRYARAAVQLAQELQDQYLAGGDAGLMALARFDAERPHLDQARRWAALHAGTEVGDALLVAEAVATIYIGDLRYDKRRERIPQLEPTLAAARRLGDQHNEGRILNLLGNAYYYLGDLRQALPYYEQVGTVARMQGNRRGESVSLSNLGLVYIALGEAARAIPYYQQALMITREIGNRRSESNMFCMLGHAYVDLGEVAHAIPYYQQARSITSEIGDRHGEAVVLNGLGKAYRILGDVRQAIELCEQALEIMRQIGDRRQEGHTLSYLGHAYTALGEPARAASLFDRALALFRTVGDRHSEAECGWDIGRFLLRQGDRDSALPLLRAVVAHEQEIGHARAEEHAALLARLEAGEDPPPEVLPVLR